MKYAFIQRYKRVWPILVQCRVLGVSVSRCHQHLARRWEIARRRHLSDEALVVQIRAGLCREPRSLRLEWPFRILKCVFGYAKVRYRGLKKNLEWLQAAFALVNLYQHRKRLVILGT